MGTVLFVIFLPKVMMGIKELLFFSSSPSAVMFKRFFQVLSKMAAATGDVS